jgi:hypothetical protein
MLEYILPLANLMVNLRNANHSKICLRRGYNSISKSNGKLTECKSVQDMFEDIIPLASLIVNLRNESPSKICLRVEFH